MLLVVVVDVDEVDVGAVVEVVLEDPEPEVPAVATVVVVDRMVVDVVDDPDELIVVEVVEVDEVVLPSVVNVRTSSGSTSLLSTRIVVISRSTVLIVS